MLCPNCETENSEGARLCSECGFPLSGAIARGAGAASPSRRTPSYQRPDIFSDAPDASWSGSLPTAVQQHMPSHPSIEEELSRQSSDFSWEAPQSSSGIDASYIEESPFFDDSMASGAYDGERASGGYRPSYDQDVLRANSAYAVPAPQHDADITRSFQPVDAAVSGDPQSRRKSQGQTLPDPAADNLPPIGYSSDQASFEQDDFMYGFDDAEPFDAFEDYGETRMYDAHGRDTSVEDFYLQGRSDYAGIQDTMRVPKITGREDPRGPRDYRASAPKKRLGKKQLGLVIGGAAAVIIALIALIGFALGLWGGHAVPNVVGMTQQEAEAALEHDGFSVKAVEEKSDEAEGIVLSMNPGAGSFAGDGAEITISVSTARTIPNVVGDNIDAAKKALAEAGYENIEVKVKYTTGTEGTVLSVSPEPDTRAKGSAKVTLTVAENLKVPDISGKSLDEAISTLEDAGLVPVVSYVDTDQYPDGTVMGTEPTAGTKVEEGDAVSISVSRLRGVELVALAEELLQSGETVDIGGVSYQIESVTSVSYQGDDIVSYTITAKPFVTFFGETLYASSSQTVSGEIQYSSDNEVISIT